MKILLLVLLLSSCSSLPAERKTIAGGASGQVDYCVMFLSTNLICINAVRKLDTE